MDSRDWRKNKQRGTRVYLASVETAGPFAFTEPDPLSATFMAILIPNFLEETFLGQPAAWIHRGAETAHCTDCANVYYALIEIEDFELTNNDSIAGPWLQIPPLSMRYRTHGEKTRRTIPHYRCTRVAYREDKHRGLGWFRKARETEARKCGKEKLVKKIRNRQVSHGGKKTYERGGKRVEASCERIFSLSTDSGKIPINLSW